MLKLLIVFAASMALAYISEQNTKAIVASGRRYSVWNDWAYLLLVTILVLFAGLRTSYNDTYNYVTFYQNAPTISEFLADADNLNPFKNPLFYLYQSFLKTCGCDAQVLIFISAVIAQIGLLLFIKRYSANFVFSIFIYFALGTFVFTLAAIKQVVAMAIVVFAFPYLEKKKWGRYYFIVIIAALIHTYAIAFAVLPFFTVRPWRRFTFVFVALMVVLMMNFEEVITAFMEQANDLGKTLAEYEIFDNQQVNIFRLAVYTVTPLISLVLQKWVLRDSTQRENVLIHMSIISLAFMAMGTQTGANMFGRMGTYFELGTICCLPKMLNDAFEKRSYRLISGVAAICFFGYFAYANAINIDFGVEYTSISLWQFISSLF